MASKGRQRVSSTREGVCHNLGKGHKPCQGLRRVSLATPSLTMTRQSSGRSHHSIHSILQAPQDSLAGHVVQIACIVAAALQLWEL